MAEELTLQKRHAFSGWPMIVAWVAMMIFAFHASTHMVAAGDTWVAMACGRHFINHGVDTVEPFSAHSHKAGPTEEEVAKWPGWAQWITNKIGLKNMKIIHPTGWVNQNWLTHVIFYWTTHLSPVADAGNYSFNTLVYWKLALYIASVICVYYTGRILGANPALSATFACFAMFIARSFLDIRPAGFSNMLVAVFLLVLVLAVYRNILYIWLLVPLTVFWCNVHGGYLYVFIMLVLFVGLNFLTSFWPKYFVTTGFRGLIHVIAAGVVTLIGCLVLNPFHLTNLTHTFIISFSKHAEMWRTVHEWHPAFAWANPVGTGFPFLILFALTIGLGLFWLFSCLIKPRVLIAPKNVLDRQHNLMRILGNIFAWTLAVFLFWVICISLSYCGSDIGSLIFFGAIMVIILLSLQKNIHLVYLAVPVIMLGMVLLHPELRKTLAQMFGGLELFRQSVKGYGGRYVLCFLLVPTYAIAAGIRRLITGQSPKYNWSILAVLGTAVVCMVLVIVLFGPFGDGKASLDNLWNFLKDAPNISRPWRPVFERNLDIMVKAYNGYWLWGLFVANVSALVLWWLVPIISENLKEQAGDETPAMLAGKTEQAANTYTLSKFDVTYLAIALLTTYMAYKSRRFIPIAAFAACPLVAVFIDRMAGTISASFNFYKKGNFSIRPMPKRVELSFAVTGLVVVLMFGTWCGLKFKRVYLDPWPTDSQLNSVFMRMTASHAKPFWTLQFIKENKLSGNMFNYWTEGGFIAYGQEPDPNDGKTPLRLFMDGRAQAAYEPVAFWRWNGLMAGTAKGKQLKDAAKARRRRLTKQEFLTIGQELTKVFRQDKNKVWAVLMPLNAKVEIILESLEQHPEWELAFYNDKQKLYVDITTERGKSLVAGIFDGTTKFPDKYSKHMTMAHILLSRAKTQEAAQKGLENAIAAMNLNPTQLAMLEVLSARRFRPLVPAVASFCKQYYDNFVENEEVYRKKDGLLHRYAAAGRAGSFLIQITPDEEAKAKYKQEIEAWTNQMRDASKDRLW